MYLASPGLARCLVDEPGLKADPVQNKFPIPERARMIDPRPIIASLPAKLQPCVQPGRPLSQLTTLRIGGPASLLCQVHNPEAARRFQALAMDLGAPYTVLGAGSNILAADEGYPGLVMQVATEDFRVSGQRITAGAGWNFDDLIARTLDCGLTGLEFASGIPGTLGGAIIGNAGCYGREIGEFLVAATVLRQDGQLVQMQAEDFGFRYRASRLRDRGDILLDATLQLSCGDKLQAVQERTRRIADRRLKHPVDLPTAGSYFKNLEPGSPGEKRQPAGGLLEQVGAKSMREGDACVFAGHANMIVNLGQASCSDVLRLAARMKQAVLNQFGVQLVEEVRYLGPPGSRVTT